MRLKLELYNMTDEQLKADFSCIYKELKHRLNWQDLDEFLREEDLMEDIN